mmetsp:Transcript_10297/g.19490  ORF Transcript_10297/g.19490 Transcript_10297/m.19490 type:complete len:431 (-) Transcript_10297:253-1545(-)|eukprot:CAMPEP_0114256924 /NCGR_PEP_ID=MMETSP0058-20121206/18442_1 /TAXON_ID=36894 /ORGANISM="Pyramimonas parkeae, CCMP726" /LENGTH=430 /DNA_ID=CAMNT_0001371583 /DNA_START=84 /DNA_END=1376 /DNA_ORIENTATION=-
MDRSGVALDGAEKDDRLMQFQAITGSNNQIATSLLDSHHWDVNDAVNFFMEHGVEPDFQDSALTRAAPPSPLGIQPDHFMDAEDSPPRRRDAGVRATSAVMEEDDNVPSAHVQPFDDELEDQMMAQAMADSMNNPASFQSPPPLQPTSIGGAEVAGESDLARAIRESLKESGPGDALDAARMSSLNVQGTRARQPTRPVGSAAGPAVAEAGFVLPEGVDAEEARMLEAVMMGVPYTGNIPSFEQLPDAAAAAAGTVADGAPPPSPGLVYSRMLRDEQDRDLQMSLEADRAKEAAAAAQRARLKAEAEATAAEQQKQQAEEEEAAAKLTHALSQKRLVLPSEPDSTGDDVVTVLVRAPNGCRISRRFLRSNNVQALFDYIDVEELAKDHPPGSYKLVTQFPRRIFTDGSADQTFEQAGLNSKQEALLLEPL